MKQILSAKQPLPPCLMQTYEFSLRLYAYEMISTYASVGNANHAPAFTHPLAHEIWPNFKLHGFLCILSYDSYPFKCIALSYPTRIQITPFTC